MQPLRAQVPVSIELGGAPRYGGRVLGSESEGSLGCFGVKGLRLCPQAPK